MEGICEAMLLPALAAIVLAEYNQGRDETLPASFGRSGSIRG